MYLQEEIRAITNKMAKLYDNPIAVITKNSGLSRPTVSKFYNLHPLKPSSIEKLYDVCLELIEEKEKKRNRSLKKEHSMLNGVEHNIQTSLEV